MAYHLLRLIIIACDHIYVSVPLTLLWDANTSYAGMSFYFTFTFVLTISLQTVFMCKYKKIWSTVTRAKSLNKMLWIAVTFSVYLMQSKLEKYWQIKLFIFIFLCLRQCQSLIASNFFNRLFSTARSAF
jgi:hypothetical protein